MTRVDRRARLLFKGSAKLALVVALAGGAGLVVGIGISELSDNGGGAGIATEDASAATTFTTRARGTKPTTVSASPPAGPRDPLEQVRVSVGSSVLHPASSSYGRRRNRARLGVRVTVTNSGTGRVVLPRPALLAARRRVTTNPRADRAATHVAALSGATTASVTLQIETAGAVTQRLTRQKRARVVVAGRSWPFVLTVGTPATKTAGPTATAR